MYPYNPYSYYYYPPHIHYEHRHPNIPYSPAYSSYRSPPRIDTTIFMNSARQTQLFIRDADLILRKLAGSKQFSLNIMNAAQESKHAQVTELIKSTGIKKVPVASYSPNGLTLTFTDEQNDIDCCHLILKVRWAKP
jgi:hypothetical protein